jgi:hypothetical protein
VAAFAALVVATIAAFFITQHLKSTNPLLVVWTPPAPFSNDGDGCRNRTSITFNLQNRSDSVSVFVLDSDGDIVRTVASGVEMQKPSAHHRVRRTFYWSGREDSGQLAPNGTYHFQVALANQGRIEDLTQYPIVVDTVPPHLVVTSVSPSQLPAPGATPATVRFTGSKGRGGLLIIYRTGLTGPPRVVDARKIPFSARSSHGYAKTWNGLIHGRPAPAGTYVMALKVTDRACVTGTFPAYLPPQVGTTEHAGVTVSYLAAEPPLDPVPAGSVAVVGVAAAGQQRYHWALRRIGGKVKPIEQGSGASTSLRVRVPRRSAGLYELAIRAGGQRTQVPIVARSATGGHHVLVVLPALTWQGENPVDDNGDGFPETLAGGGPIVLHRQFIDGLPSDFAGEAALLTRLDRAGLPYDLTTDVAMVDGSGPALAGHSGVVFAGPEVWLPAALAPALRSYVEHGGRVLALGAGTLQRTATVKQTPSGLQAADPSSAAATDVLGGRRGPLVTDNTEAIVRISDGLGLFNGTSGTFAGFGSFEPIPAVAPPGQIVAEAGTTTQTPSIVGYRLGSGAVVEIGLPAFTLSLAHDVDTQELLRRLWTILYG